MQAFYLKILISNFKHAWTWKLTRLGAKTKFENLQKFI